MTCLCTLFVWINLSKSLYILILLFVINVVCSIKAVFRIVYTSILDYTCTYYIPDYNIINLLHSKQYNNSILYAYC